MAWYPCEISFLVQFTPASLGGLHDEARDPSYLRELERPYQDYLFGQVTGSAQEKAERRAAVQDFLQSPDCQFLLSHPPGEPDALPSLDGLRQRVGHAIAVYNTLNPDLNFSTRVMGDPTNLRLGARGNGRTLTCTYQLTVVDRHGQPLDLPPGVTRAGAWHVGVEVRETR